MKSIAFFVLLLLAVATSGNMLNGWQNLTGVHEDGEEVIWVSLVPDKKNYITHHTLNRQPAFPIPCSARTARVLISALTARIRRTQQAPVRVPYLSKQYVRDPTISARYSTRSVPARDDQQAIRSRLFSIRWSIQPDLRLR
ncbi:hypothetical protein F2Q68_00041383 [Brassica cretica]|uniref:Uncharacterized protein n=1 Tax=Brassica cretica TaxID=69181 RepID=A0A8S9MNR0_BRACR|nr:hypothetical protein F2Q68_00041383 [Brassica cretica]